MSYSYSVPAHEPGSSEHQVQRSISQIAPGASQREAEAQRELAVYAIDEFTQSMQAPAVTASVTGHRDANNSTTFTITVTASTPETVESVKQNQELVDSTASVPYESQDIPTRTV